MKLALLITCIGLLLVVFGLAFAYFRIANLEHTVTSSNFISSVVGFLETELIAIAFLVVGGLMVILGNKKS